MWIELIEFTNSNVTAYTNLTFSLLFCQVIIEKYFVKDFNRRVDELNTILLLAYNKSVNSAAWKLMTAIKKPEVD